MNKRLITLMAILMLIFPLLAACGGDDDNQATATSGGGAGATATTGGGGGTSPTATTGGGGGGEPTQAATGGPSGGAGPVEGEGGDVAVFHGWAGEEKAAFEQVAKYCDQTYKTKTALQGASGDYGTELSTRVQGGTAPDIAFVSTPSTMQEYIEGEAIQPVDFLNDHLTANYAPVWMETTTIDGKNYGVHFKADNKALVWYNPKKFKQGNFEVPKTYDEMVELSNKMVAAGKAPWAFGAKDGWTLTDFFENVYLRIAGPEKYDQLVAHEIPWTDESVRTTFETMNKIIANDKFIAGGRSTALGQGWADAAVQALSDQGKAQMFQEASFVGAAIVQELPKSKAGEDFDFFEFPPIGEQAAGATPVVVGPNIALMFKDSPGARAFMRCLGDPKAQEQWAKRGGFLSPTKTIDASVYPSDIVRRQAQMLTKAADAGQLRFDASDVMPAKFGSDYFFRALQDYFKNPNNLDELLNNLEREAERAY